MIVLLKNSALIITFRGCDRLTRRYDQTKRNFDFRNLKQVPRPNSINLGPKKAQNDAKNQKSEMF